MTQVPMTVANDLLASPAYDPDAMLPIRVRRARIALAAMVLGLGGLAAFLPMGAAVIAPGQIGVESRIKRVAHPYGGTIAEIFVSNGQHVRKGDKLIRLDDKVSGGDADLSHLSVDQLLAQRARLEAESTGTAHIAFPALLTQRNDPGAIRAMADEQRQFAIHRGETAGLIAQLQARIAQYEQQIRSQQAQVEALRRQAGLIEPELRGLRELYDKQLVTITRKNQLERTSVSIDGEAASLEANMAEARSRISEARAQILEATQKKHSDAGALLAQVNAALNQQQSKSLSSTDMHDRSLLVAPYDGVIDKLAFSAAGDVIRPAETILEVVPDKDQLVVEAAIAPTDIDQVRNGQPVRIKFTSLNSTATPELTGRVIFVAPSRTSDPDGHNSFFPARIMIDGDALKRHSTLRLRPGLPAELFIETGSRSMLSYLTKPLRDQFDRAFTDN